MQKVVYLTEDDMEVIKTALKCVMEEPKLDKAKVTSLTLPKALRAVDNLTENGEGVITDLQLHVIRMSLDYYALDLLQQKQYEALIGLLNTALKLRNLKVLDYIKYYFRVM